MNEMIIINIRYIILEFTSILKLLYNLLHNFLLIKHNINNVIINAVNLIVFLISSILYTKLVVRGS